ncbi:MAG: hypothetical protein ACE5J5_08665, partial [Candidatus Hydrothermarchaeales archaeon]
NSLQISPHPFYPNYKGDITGGYLYKYKPNSIWATQYPDNNRGYFNERNQITYKLNSDGYRDSEFKPKHSSIYRIISIGDSFALGEGVKSEDTYSKVLEKLLKSINRNIEVYT